MKSWWEDLTDLLWPRFCPCCGKKLLRMEDILCTECILGMPLTYFWNEPFNPMADRLNKRISSGKYANAMALYFYRGDYRKLSMDVKYFGNVTLGHYLGRALGRKAALSPWLKDVDTIVPVPLHWQRRISRGYNQAEVIAEAFAAIVGARVDTRLLRRVRSTASQTELSPAGKAANVAGAFEADLRHLQSPPRHILLLDDVFTTGSTLAECYNVLNEAFDGAVNISVATLAAVGE